jgi:polyhydroxybutyrate depolymerase
VRLAVLGLAVLLALGCKSKPEAAASEPPKADAASAAMTAATAPRKDGPPALPPTARPYNLYVPAGLDRSKPAPLVLFFHGYGSTGAGSARALGILGAADAHGFVVAYPDGTIDGQGNRFWSASDACCNFASKDVDDVAYAAWILDDVASRAKIDPKRVYAAGHSNGGFMALRLACDLSPRFAAVVSVAGAAHADPSRCNPSEPVSVLQIHGDADAVVHYGGGVLFDVPSRVYPGAEATVASWAAKDHCGGPPAPSGSLFDFDYSVPGAETTRKTAPGCPDGISVDLWTVAGGSHQLIPTPAGLDAVWSWMAAHPKR